MGGFPGAPGTGIPYIDSLIQMMKGTTAVGWPIIDPNNVRTPDFNPNAKSQRQGTPKVIATIPAAPTPPPAAQGAAPTPPPAPVAGAPAPVMAPIVQPGSAPAKPGTIVPYEGNIASRLYQGMKDPRFQAFVLNAGNRLLQPPQFGESQTMKFGQGLISGYQGLTALSALQQAQARQAAADRMAKEKHDVEVGKTKAETGEITERAAATKAGVGYKGREVSALEATQKATETNQQGQLGLGRDQLSALIKKNENDYDVALKNWQTAKDKNVSDAEIARARTVLDARKLDGELLAIHTNAAKVQDDMLNGRDATARIEVMKQQVEIIKQMIASAPMGTDLQPYHDAAQKALASVTGAQPGYKPNVQSAVPAPSQLATPSLPPSFTAPPQRTEYDSQGNLISAPPSQAPPASTPVAPIGGSPMAAPPTAAAPAAGAASPAASRVRYRMSQSGGAESLDVTEGIDKVAQAMAQFEGFGKPGSVAQRNNNPGALRAGPGQVGTDAGGYAIFPDVETGWAALRSHIAQNAGKGLTFREYIAKYAPKADRNDPEAYATTVAGQLGVDPGVGLEEIISGRAPMATAPPAASPPPATSQGPTPAPAGTPETAGPARRWVFVSNPNEPDVKGKRVQLTDNEIKGLRRDNFNVRDVVEAGGKPAKIVAKKEGEVLRTTADPAKIARLKDNGWDVTVLQGPEAPPEKLPAAKRRTAAAGAVEAGGIY